MPLALVLVAGLLLGQAQAGELRLRHFDAADGQFDGSKVIGSATGLDLIASDASRGDITLTADSDVRVDANTLKLDIGQVSLSWPQTFGILAGEDFAQMDLLMMDGGAMKKFDCNFHYEICGSAMAPGFNASLVPDIAVLLPNAGIMVMMDDASQNAAVGDKVYASSTHPGKACLWSEIELVDDAYVVEIGEVLQQMVDGSSTPIPGLFIVVVSAKRMHYRN